MATQPAPAGASEKAATPAAVSISDRYRRYALGMLVVIYVFNFIDRSILGILIEDIKRDLELSDTAIGFLTGIAFALIYTTAGIPIARWADTGVRRSIIALGLGVWSAMTALCGFAQNLWQLSAARFGVGLGEAACSPPAHSLISDYFPPERRATALSIYALGIPIGAAIGNLTGGWINEFFDWRVAFLVVGVPGVLLALIARLTLREPPRGYSEPEAAAVESSESVGEVIRFLWRLPSFRHISIGGALHAFYGYGALAFVVPFFVRVHEFGTGELGTYLALLGAVFGGLGTYLGGRVGDWLAGRGEPRYYAWVPAYATIFYIPFAFLFYLWPNGYVALALSIPGSIAGAMWLGPTFAMTQALVKLRMRALAAAILLFVVNMIGMGLGPQLTGILSDLLEPRFGLEAIRYALLVVVVAGAAWSSLHFLLAARTLREDLQAKDR